MPAIIVLADHTGRLGNKLILFAHVIAAAREFGSRVVNLSILPAAKYFAGLYLNPLGTYPNLVLPIDVSWLFRAFRKPIQIWVRRKRIKPLRKNRWVKILDMENKPIYFLESPEFASLVKRYKVIFLWGYSFRCPGLVRKHAATLRDFFKIRPQIAPQIETRFRELIGEGKEIIAAHIRQGDFKTWNNGRFFVPANRFEKSLKKGGWIPGASNQSWWICSDEIVSEAFSDKSIQNQTPRNLGEDLFIMTNADVLFAGYSTLSAFCGFLADKKFFQVSSEDAAPVMVIPDNLLN